LKEKSKGKELNEKEKCMKVGIEWKETKLQERKRNGETEV
jgi:hypothetical protein